jgi:hypothetical protein
MRRTAERRLRGVGLNCNNILQPGDSFGTYSVTVPITWGFATLVTVRLSGIVDAGYDPPTGFTVGASEDLSHSLYWAGISGATAGGNPVTNFAATGQSGANYANSFEPASAPEPGTGLLLAGALVAAAAIRKFAHFPRAASH